MRLWTAAAILAATLAAMPAAAQDKLTLLLDWFVNPDHGPIIVAQQKGYFADERLAVDVIAPADPNDPPKLVAAGKADIAVSYQPQTQIQVAAGLPLARIGTLIATPLNTLLVLESGPIKSIADLKGKKVGFSVSGFEDALLSFLLAKHGLSLKDVTLVNVNFSLSPALITGRVDAVIGAYRNFELNQMAIEKRPGRAFFVEEEGLPAYDELVFVAHADKVRDPRLPRFLSAIERGTHFLLNRPDEAWALFVKAHKALDDELNRRAWADTVRRFSASPAALDRGRWERFAAFLQSQGLAKDLPPLDRYAVVLR
ncbi:MAG: ABC transporter substrate-binding protein [Alphaproteobacteria bacterium]|nr:ABC transporter substrate-binding protein [Alphaproteobacteria bacterium]